MPYTPTYISTATTTVVRSTPGVLFSITVTGGTAGTIIVYDNATAASGTILASFGSTNAIQTYIFDVTAEKGVTVITSAATQLTVSSGVV
jgi:hypothetical protein